uniref:Uncharacterized protein n=1 Tax=Romanomermis culicivorax TaxID=13658 RepID=A0A915IDI3_ROMCU
MLDLLSRAFREYKLPLAVIARRSCFPINVERSILWKDYLDEVVGLLRNQIILKSLTIFIIVPIIVQSWRITGRRRSIIHRHIIGASFRRRSIVVAATFQATVSIKLLSWNFCPWPLTEVSAGDERLLFVVVVSVLSKLSTLNLVVAELSMVAVAGGDDGAGLLRQLSSKWAKVVCAEGSGAGYRIHQRIHYFELTPRGLASSVGRRTHVYQVNDFLTEKTSLQKPEEDMCLQNSNSQTLHTKLTATQIALSCELVKYIQKNLNPQSCSDRLKFKSVSNQ